MLYIVSQKRGGGRKADNIFIVVEFREISRKKEENVRKCREKCERQTKTLIHISLANHRC